MTQYPNDKDPHSNWLHPQQGSYTSRDGAPEYDAPAGPPPPPDYGYAQSHPQGGAGYEANASPYSQPPPAAAPAPAPDAGPSTTTTTQEASQGGFAMSLAAFFGNKGPPAMWQRQPPLQLAYNAFPAMYLISNSKDLSNGFPELPPPYQLNPHPFATHDVTEEDWKRFLGDVKKAGSLSPTQRIKSNVIPMVTGMSFVTGFFATFAIEKRMKHKNRQAAGDLVDHWNHYFFGPRRMEVVLCQASERLSGRLGVAPVGDPNQRRMADKLRQRPSDDSPSSSSSSEGEEERDSGRRARRRARRQRRAERRERKARGEHKEPYQLVVTSM